MATGSTLLTLRTFYHTLRISVPTVLEAQIGRSSLDRCDARLRDWAETLVTITRTQMQVQGLSHLPEQACVLMSNHQSLSDIPLLFAALPLSVRMRMVTKAELFRVPVWGRAMRHAGFIPIDRTNRQRAIESLEIAKRDMDSGTYIWIAPEGTRSRTGTLRPLKKGGFILAHDTGRPIVPVCIQGSQQIVPPDSVRTHFDQLVQLSFGPPIPTVGRPIEEVMDEVQRSIDPARRPPVRRPHEGVSAPEEDAINWQRGYQSP